MGGVQVGRAHRGAPLMHVGLDFGDLLGAVAQPMQRPADRLVDDRHGAAAHQLLGFDQAQIRLDAGGVAVHHERDGAGRGQHGGLRVADANRVPPLHCGIPGGSSRVQHPLRHWLGFQPTQRIPVHVQHPAGGFLVFGEPSERCQPGRHASRCLVGHPGHQRGDRGCPSPALVGVVGQAESHEHGPEVGVAQTQLAEPAGGLADLLRRIVRGAHQDLLGDGHHPDCGAESLHIEPALFVDERQQIQTGQVAGRIVQVEIFGTGVAGRDATGSGRGVPPVDGGFELHSGVGALPGGLGDLGQQPPGRHRLDDLTRGAGGELPLPVFGHRRHERVAEPHGVVGVLVLDGVDVGAVEVHVEAGVPQRPGLALLDGLAPDELGHIGVVGIQHHHLGRPPSLAPRLDGARRGVGAPHEAHRAAGGAAAAHPLPARSDSAEVDAGPRSALEDAALLAVPVEDRLHGVVHRQDEAGRRLGHGVGHPEVEPDRGVERGALADQQPAELIGERRRLGLSQMSRLGAPHHQRVHHPVDHLAQ